MIEIAAKDAEIKRQQGRVSEHEVRIGHLNLEKCNYVDIIKDLELKIAGLEKEVLKRDTWNIEL